MDMHSFLLVGVYLECIFALASEYWTHNFFSFPLAKIGNKNERCKKSGGYFSEMSAQVSEMR